MNIRRQNKLIFAGFFWLSVTIQASASDFKLPDYQTKVLDNGITVHLMPQHEIPLLHVTIAIEAGGATDIPELSGLADLTIHSLALGTKTLSKRQIEEQVELLGADISSHADDDFSSIEISMAAKDAEHLLPTLAEMIQKPRFPEKEIDKIKLIKINEIKQKNQIPRQVADEYFEHMIYGNQGYGLLLGGTLKSLSKIKRADIDSFYRLHYHPKRTIISIAGSFSPATILTLVKKNFDNWQPLEKSRAEPKYVRSHTFKNQVLLIDKPDAGETTFRIGGVGVPRSHPEWPGLQLVNTALGGRFTSRLNEALRIKSGLTYGARSQFSANKNSGIFFISSFTASENTFRTLDLALETYNTFLQEGLNQVELESAKAYVKGQFPPRFETLESLCQAMAQSSLLQLKKNSIDHFLDDIESITLSQAQSLIKQYFPKDALKILLIGNGQKLQQGIRKYEPISKIEWQTAADLRFP